MIFLCVWQIKGMHSTILHTQNNFPSLFCCMFLPLICNCAYQSHDKAFNMNECNYSCYVAIRKWQAIKRGKFNHWRVNKSARFWFWLRWLIFYDKYKKSVTIFYQQFSFSIQCNFSNGSSFACVLKQNVNLINY